MLCAYIFTIFTAHNLQKVIIRYVVCLSESETVVDFIDNLDILNILSLR